MTIGAALPSGDTANAVNIVDRQYALFRDIPSYRGLRRPGGGFRRYFDAGATEVVATRSGIRNFEERLRTWRVLRDLVKP